MYTRTNLIDISIDFAYRAKGSLTSSYYYNTYNILSRDSFGVLDVVSIKLSLHITQAVKPY